MADSCIGLAVGGVELDRLTGLPINVIHQIQDCMPIEDAARMSVLSSTLRYVWASNPKLVFDRRICQKIFGTNTVDNTISTILLQHQGAIKKFSLDVSTVPSSQRSSVNEWMLLLSRNGVVDLTLGNVETAIEDVFALYELPSCVYNAALERLYLYNCIFRPPCSFTGFHGLTRLRVMRSSFELSAATSVLWMPNLVSLLVMWCSGVRFLKICAPELQELLYCGHGTDPLTLSAFMDCGKLKVVGITFKGQVSRNRQDKAVKLTNVLSSWPNVRSLVFDRHFFKFFASGTEAAERLPTTLNRLNVLRLHNFSF